MNLHYLDIAIVGGYLTACLIIGLMKFDKVKTLKDYTLGVKPFSNIVLFSTVFATAIGLSRTVGVVEKSYELGIVFVIPLVISPLLWIVMSKLLAPNLGLFKQEQFMTLGDIMGYWYGETGKWVTTVCSIIIALAITGASITAIGYLCTHFLGISPIYGGLIAVVVITLYSALGGVQAVAYTDLFQMLIFFIALPVISIIGLNEAGGIVNVFSSLPVSHLKIDTSNISMFLSFIFCELLPVTGIPFIQRALIAKDKWQLTQSFRATGIGIFFFLLCMSMMGLIMYTINPKINPNTALYYFMSHYLYPGILGVALAGLLAVIMSTQDSFLNSASTLIARDVCKEIWPTLTDKNQLTIARISCFIITGTATSVALLQNSVLGIIWSVNSFWNPLITIPLVAALWGIRIEKKYFIILTIASTAAVLLVRSITGTFDPRSSSVGALVSILVLYVAHRKFKAKH